MILGLCFPDGARAYGMATSVQALSWGFARVLPSNSQWHLEESGLIPISQKGTTKQREGGTWSTTQQVRQPQGEHADFVLNQTAGSSALQMLAA